MAYCRKCGVEIDGEAAFCYKCGAPQNYNCDKNTNHTGIIDNGSFVWFWLGFLLPVIGCILYLVWRDSKPKNAFKANLGSIFGVVFVMIVANIIIFSGI